MNINEIKPGNYYTNGRGVYVMASGAVQDNEFQATNIELGQVRMYPISEFSHCTFHEAFRNDVNKIVLEAVTSQNKDSLYDHTGRNSLAVSDMQKKWILDHYVLKHEASENLEKENLLLKERIMELTQKNIDMQTKYTQKIKDVELLCFHYENQKKFIQHLQGYIAAKHLESEGLILEKFIQEENTNASKKESN